MPPRLPQQPLFLALHPLYLLLSGRHILVSVVEFRPRHVTHESCARSADRLPPSSSAAALCLRCTVNVSIVLRRLLGSACKARVSERRERPLLPPPPPYPAPPTPPSPTCPTPAPSAHRNQRVASIFNPSVTAGASSDEQKAKRTTKERISAKTKDNQRPDRKRKRTGRTYERKNRFTNKRTIELRERDTPNSLYRYFIL